MNHTCRRERVTRELAVQLIPGSPARSRAAAEPLAPADLHLVPEPTQCLDVAGDSEVSVMSAELASQHSSLIRHRQDVIALFVMPPYSLELAGGEWVGKQAIQRIARQSGRTRENLKKLVLSASGHGTL